MKSHCLLPLALSLLLTACSVGPDYVVPTAPSTSGYKEAGDWKQAEPRDDALRGAWWKIYHDPQLETLEEQVNISNQNVLEAEAKFREAAATVKVTRTGFYPTVNASPSFTESQSSQSLSSGGKSGSQHVGATAQSLYNLPLEGSYLADVWGSIRRSVEADSTTAQATFADLENARLSYQATLAEDYFSLRGIDAEEDILNRTVADDQKFLDLTTNRYTSGIASKGDVAQAKTQLDTTRTQLIDLGVSRAQFEHAIAVLTGRPPSALALAKAPLTGTPPRIPVGVPSTLLERRPDIAAAERRVASANASIGVATAAYYPTITLSGNTGLESIQLSQLFSGPSFLWSVGPVIAQTIFNAGKTHGLVQEAQANYEATVAAYRETVLTALQQVEDDLSGLRILEDEAASNAEAIKSAQDSLAIVTNQYQAGTTDALTVITARNTELGDELTGVSIRTRRMTTSVLLIEAVGGGWDASQLPTTHQVANVPRAEAEVDKGKK